MRGLRTVGLGFHGLQNILGPSRCGARVPCRGRDLAWALGPRA